MTAITQQTGERKSFSRDEVGALLRSVITTVESEKHPSAAKIYNELSALAHYIEQTRADLAKSQPGEISSRHIPMATDELDAVVGATAEATNAIMDSCEKIENVCAALTDPEAKNALTESVTRIYEACGFQDITGQRITKVVGTLKHIEEKVAHILKAVEGGGETAADRPAEEDTRKDDARLLNGPQMPGKGVDQDEIDRLLAAFDNNP